MDSFKYFVFGIGAVIVGIRLIWKYTDYESVPPFDSGRVSMEHRLPSKARNAKVPRGYE